MKKCFKSNCHKHGEEQPFSEFYKHKQMADGYLGKCKTCTKKDVTENRNKNIEHYRLYDRDRGCRQLPEYQTQYRTRKPNAYKAIIMVNNAKRDGKLFEESCEICGSNNRIHAHHDDYLKPLNVRWLCAAHHKQWHRDNGEALNPF